jgi:hypothetical protein
MAKPLKTEKPPKKVAPFPPAGGVFSKVVDGDTWESVAKMFKMDVKKLIDFNFKTNDPEEVNWYLREKVGCQLNDGKNWKFSTSASPGKVFHPPVPILTPFPTSPPTPQNPFERLPRMPTHQKRGQDWTVTITAKDGSGDWVFKVFVGLDGKWFSNDPDVGGGSVDISDISGSGGTALKSMGEKVLSLGGHKFIEREKNLNGKGAVGMGKFHLNTKFGPREFGDRKGVKADFKYVITEVPDNL